MSVDCHPRDQAVQSMFDRIAGRYDLLNRIISFRLDSFWRNQTIRSVLSGENPLVIDLGTGTGDLAFTAARLSRGSARIIGLDFSFQMLRRARNKRAQSAHGANASFVQGSAMAVPLKADVFDGAMTAFVLRNVSDLALFFREAYRVLKPGARLVSLDMFPPSAGWFSVLYSVYFHKVMPWIGGLLSSDRKAYQYLSDSVRQFYSPETVVRMIEAAGFQDVTIRRFLRGAVCMHRATKPLSIETKV